jgi:hypothetical protein
MAMYKPGKIIPKSSAEQEFDLKVNEAKILADNIINAVVDGLVDLHRNNDERIRLTKIIEEERSKPKGN